MRKPFHPSEPSDEKGLEYWYVERRTLADFRRGPIGPYFDGFAASLKRNGYSERHGIQILSTGCLFNAWLIDRGITSISGVSESQVDPFIEVILAGFRTTSVYSPRTERQRCLHHLFLYLAAIKVVTPPTPKRILTAYSWLFDPYVRHLRDEREVAPVTLKRHVRHITAFLEDLKDDVQRTRLHALGPDAMEAHIKHRLKTSKDNVHSLSSSLRRFLSYCALHGFIKTDYSGLVPRSRTYRHASLPRGVDDSALERVLGLIDRDSANGARDYAVMLVLMAYGVRAISACRLALEDIDWPQSRIRFRAQKGGKEVVVPLIDAVGEAIIQWLRHRDPRTPYREVFLSTKAPHGPLSNLAISKVAQTLMRKAGVHQPGRGAHTLRHSWAIRALQNDQPIKAIADVLGHRYIDTTYIYAKADLKMLRQVAMPWPKR